MHCLNELQIQRWTDKYEKYRAASEKLVNATLQFKHIPIKFYRHGRPPIQELFPALHPQDGSETTLYDALSIIFPDRYPSRIKEDSTSPSSATESMEQRLSEQLQQKTTLLSSSPQPVYRLSVAQTIPSTPIPQSPTENQSGGSVHVVLHGVVVPMETPLPWLARNMAYADHFLHIALHEHT